EKPLGPLFECFRALRMHVPATLHVYGGGNPALYRADVDRLQLAPYITFEGHRESLVDTVVKDGLTMCWLMSVDTLLGYASIELAACAMPMLFWNYGRWNTQRIAGATGGAIRSFSSVDLFVEEAVRCLTDDAE